MSGVRKLSLKVIREEGMGKEESREERLSTARWCETRPWYLSVESILV